MWLIVGLGNPGKSYVKTRHNLGFMVIDVLSSKFSIPLKQKSRNFSYGKGIFEGKDLMLLKPLTFMNNSGIAVKDAFKKYAKIDNMIVIHDDLDLEKGVVRIKKRGSAGGHRGVESVIDITGTKDFLRLKIGIGRSDRLPAEDYVLRPFAKRETSVMNRAVETAADAVLTILDKGLAHAQNKFHTG